jgi:1-phosphatidylinositol-3-phosphate 5-kinase
VIIYCRHVLIELAPAYFRYMDATTSKPTVLAKLLGFYTVEIKNLETGTTQAKADLLVMENLFYNQQIVKTFDLKGIQGRKVKAASNSSGSKTLFDGDWIEGQQRALTLVQPYSKVVLQEAIKADCEFLAKSNIMDYSCVLSSSFIITCC